jgi:hypothetical protein
MASTEYQARHVFHAPTSGWDRIHAWREATGEPAFVWGRGSMGSEGRFFGSVKRDFANWLEATGPATLTVYHDGAGADAIGAMDPAANKVLFLHHWFPRWERNFDWTIRCTGKVLVGHPSMVERLRSRYGWIPERFIHTVPQPALQTSLKGGDGSGAKARTGIWLHGKNWRRHGNRLRSIADRWPADAGELEILVTGAGRPGWSRKNGILWSANLPFEFALHRLHTWDSTLLLNDYALDAPWLLDALRLGCFPLVPDGDGVAGRAGWDADNAPKPYPWGDVVAAAELLTGWRTERDALLEGFRGWVEAVQPEPATFQSAWSWAKAAILDQRAPKLRQRRAVAGWQPVGWYERIQRMRAGI